MSEKNIKRLNGISRQLSEKLLKDFVFELCQNFRQIKSF
jgi:hypothetical protein